MYDLKLINHEKQQVLYERFLEKCTALGITHGNMFFP